MLKFNRFLKICNIYIIEFDHATSIFINLVAISRRILTRTEQYLVNFFYEYFITFLIIFWYFWWFFDFFFWLILLILNFDFHELTYEPYSVPLCLSVSLQVRPGVDVGFRFHQPVFHFISLKVKIYFFRETCLRQIVYSDNDVQIIKDK